MNIQTQRLNQVHEQEIRSKLYKHKQGDELLKDVVWVVFAAIFCGYAVNYFI